MTCKETVSAWQGARPTARHSQTTPINSADGRSIRKRLDGSSFFHTFQLTNKTGIRFFFYTYHLSVVFSKLKYLEFITIGPLDKK
jgi:hypothetical protein